MSHLAALLLHNLFCILTKCHYFLSQVVVETQLDERRLFVLWSGLSACERWGRSLHEHFWRLDGVIRGRFLGGVRERDGFIPVVDLLIETHQLVLALTLR